MPLPSASLWTAWNCDLHEWPRLSLCDLVGSRQWFLVICVVSLRRSTCVVLDCLRQLELDWGGKGELSFDYSGAAFSQEATEHLCSLFAGCLAEWPRRSGISPPAVGPSSKPSPPAHHLASTPSATTAQVAPLTLAVATALPWVATPTAWIHHPCSMAQGLVVGPAVSDTMTAPVPSWRIHPPSASTCLMPSPSGCAWCAGTLLLGTITVWLPVRHAKPSSRGLFKVQCTNFCQS